MNTDDTANPSSIPKKKIVGFVPQSDDTEAVELSSPKSDSVPPSSELGSQLQTSSSATQKPSSASSQTSNSSRKSHMSLTSNATASSPIPTSTSPNSFQPPMHASYEKQWLLDDDRGGRSPKRLSHSGGLEDKLGSPRESVHLSANARQAPKGKPKQKQQDVQPSTSPGSGSGKGASSENKQPSAASSATIADTSRPNPASADGTVRKSNKEMTKSERRALQEKQRAEKEARKTGEQKPSSVGSTKAGKPMPGGQDAQAASAAVSNAAASSATTTPAVAVSDAATLEKQKKKQQAMQNQVPWLSHLDSPKRPSTSSAAAKDLHPAMLALGLQFAEYKIAGSNARCVAMLSTFSKIIRDHKPPSDATFSRHIQKHLDPHIAYLLTIRPMSLSMRECIRWLKKEMAEIVEEDPPLPDEEARNRLIERIAIFIRDRITVADALIVQNGLQKIQNGDVILTYARSSIVQSLLLEVHKKGVDFRVIIVDSRPMFEGKHLLKRLVAAGITCSYVLLSAAQSVMPQVTKVLLGAHALLNNGAVYSRIGTAMVAMAASDKRIPVIVCCETYKFVNRTQVDALVLNEIGNPDDLVETNKASQSAYNRALPSSSTGSSAHSTPLAGWREQPNLKLLNLMYDVTPSEYITVVVTEVGLIPCTSAPVIWREYNEEFRKRPQTK